MKLPTRKTPLIPALNSRCWTTLALAAFFSFSPAGSGRAADAEDPAGADGAEVLTRGPVHEAFAEAISFQPVDGVTVPKAPPEAIEELPPDQRPDGDNVTWIPGYWAWNDEAEEFLWVSGIWRNLPPGRQWIPGYWNESGSSWQWVSGYWADAAEEEVEYLSEPPASVESGPNVKAPSADHAWTPGCWVWNDTRYRWRPGYWAVARPDWVWVPAHYVRTPYGWVYVDGYWDYAVARRGLVFAPVRFVTPIYARPEYHYRPVTVININIFADQLFIRPRHRHYYFGDYYDPIYRRSGFYASYTYTTGGHGYDPIFVHERWCHRHDSKWERRVEDNFIFFRDNRDERPPHTYVEFQKFIAKPDRKTRIDVTFAASLTQISTRKDVPFKLKAVDNDERGKFISHAKDIRDFGKVRRDFAKDNPALVETGKLEPGRKPDKSNPDSGKPPKVEPVKVKLPKSPVFSRVSDKVETSDGPPKRLEPAIAETKRGKPGKDGRPETTDEPGNDRRKPGDKPKVASEDIPDNMPGRKPKFDPGDQPKLDPKPSDSDEPKRDPKKNPKINPRDLPKTNPKPETPDLPKPEKKTEPKPEMPRIPKTEPKIDPDSIPKKKPKFEPKPEPRTEPKPQPRTEPKPQPRFEPKPQPKFEPKPQPKFEPKPQPKFEPKPQPKFEPKPQPKFEPKPQPKFEPKPPDSSEDKKKDKDKDRRRPF